MEAFMDKMRLESNFSIETDDELDDSDSRNNNGLELKSPQHESSANFEANMSSEDVELCQQLDEEYERALEEREIGYSARYASVRQSAVISVFFMISFLFLGTAFFIRQAHWSIRDSLLFSVYTITTVGYGNHEIPTAPGFQAYTIFYLFIGIAALTIMVAQVYMCIALEASRAQHSRDKNKLARRGMGVVTNSPRQGNDNRSPGGGETDPDEIIAYHHGNLPGFVDQAFRYADRAKIFFTENEIGRGISVVFPFAGLILIGAVVVGPIEGWTLLESIYFAVVSLTTVGFGDYFPTQTASIWFCIFWLPFSVGFMSLFLGNVASFYIKLSDRNIQRIERRMRRRLQQAKDRAEMERTEILKRAYRGQAIEIDTITIEESEKNVDPEKATTNIPPQHVESIVRQKKKQGFDVLPNDAEDQDAGSVFGSSSGNLGNLDNLDKGNLRRQRIIENSFETKQPGGRTMQSMGDVVRAVKGNLSAEPGAEKAEASKVKGGPESKFMSVRSTQSIVTHTGLVGLRSTTRKPSFGLRVLVQERFAEIIATDIAGFQSSMEIKDNTLSVTIDKLSQAAEKWAIPRRARKAFRAVAFEVLYFVGEYGLITRGADALFDLSPVEFHGLFSSLVAAMGDADTMEGWLAATNVLAEVDLKREVARPSNNGITPEETEIVVSGSRVSESS